MIKTRLAFKLIVISLVVIFVMSGQVTMADSIPGEKIGIVLMHGKGGTTSYVDDLGDSLKKLGIIVKTPLMPWSKGRIYDKGYEESMAEIDTYVEQLKKSGAKRIFIAGHSIGANATIVPWPLNRLITQHMPAAMKVRPIHLQSQIRHVINFHLCAQVCVWQGDSIENKTIHTSARLNCGSQSNRCAETVGNEVELIQSKRIRCGNHRGSVTCSICCFQRI